MIQHFRHYLEGFRRRYRTYFPRNDNQFGRLLYEEADSLPGTLFILEDRSQIEVAFTENEQYLSHRNRRSLSSYLALSIAIPIVGFLISNLTYGSIFTCLAVFAFFLVKPYTLYRRYKFVRDYRLLISNLSEQKSLVKKVYQLIEDSEDSVLKESFFRTTLRALWIYRNSTKLVIENCRLKDCLKLEMLCDLPEECLDFGNPDEDEITIKKLKSIRQFVRLQISEFLKHILYMFIENFYEVPPSPLRVDFLPQESICVINQELLSHLHLHKSLQVTFGGETRRPKGRQQSSEEALLWSSLRSIRKSLYSSLKSVDDCEELSEKFSTFDLKDKEKFLQDLEALLQENQSISMAILNTFRLLKGKKSSEIEELSVPESMDPEEDSGVPTGSFEEYIPKDEVFEAFIDESDDEDDFRRREDRKEHEYESEFVRQSNANMFQELKGALRPKALECKAREERALGREVHLEKIERDYEDEILKQEERKQRPKYSPYQQDKDPEDKGFSLPTVSPFSFTKELLAKTNLQAMLLNQVETFGEGSSSSESSDSSSTESDKESEGDD